MLRLADRWIWDFWLARDGPDHHIFFLHAPRALGDPDLRHANASIGHAVSVDLRSWSLLPDALGPGEPGSWDDGAPWTGCVVRHEGLWYLFYTGTSRAEQCDVQRIGVAISEDLVTWTRHPANPLMSSDARWYERSAVGAWLDEAWRDPWVMSQNAGAEHVVLMTARARRGPTDGRGAIAVARSADLLHWDIGPPIFAPGEFSELEVPQAVELAGHWYLLFSVPAGSHGRHWRERTGLAPVQTVYHVMGDGPTGPFHGPAEPILTGIDDGELYCGKLVTTGADEWWYLAARFGPTSGPFVGELTDPFPVTRRADGWLSVG